MLPAGVLPTPRVQLFHIFSQIRPHKETSIAISFNLTLGTRLTVICGKNMGFMKIIKRFTADFTKNWLPLGEGYELASTPVEKYNRTELVIEIVTWITVVIAICL